MYQSYFPFPVIENKKQNTIIKQRFIFLKTWKQKPEDEKQKHYKLFGDFTEFKHTISLQLAVDMHYVTDCNVKTSHL